MLYSKFLKNSKSELLLLDKPIILHFIPDLNSSLLDFIDNFKISIHNLQGILIKPQIIKISSEMINTRNYLNSMRSKIQDFKSITIYMNYPPEIRSNRFIIYDHSPVVELIESYNKKSIKKTTEFLIDYLHEIKNSLKVKYPAYDNLPVFFLKETDGLIKNISYMRRLENLNFFDRYALMVNDKYVVSLCHFNNGVPILNLQNLSYMKAFLKRDKEDLTPDIIEKKETILSLPIKLSNIEAKKLTKAISNTDVKDSTIISNIKNSLILNTKDESEDVKILTSTHKMLFNKEKIPDAYISSPEKLLSKLKEANIYSEELNITVKKNLLLSKPEMMVKLDSVTGPCRHKYEFNENIDFNIEKLFKVLETKNSPIQILNISKEIKDDNRERYTLYTITLKNQNNNLKYDINLRIPSLVNEKYFKLNSKDYIMSTQQFLNPITKDKPAEVRFLTNYNMIRLRLRNIKYTPSEIINLMNFISNKYSKHVEFYNKTELNLKSGLKINLNDKHNIISDENTKVKLENGEYVLYINNEKTSKKILLNEYIFDKLHDNIPELNLKISDSISYVQSYVMGIWTPLIVYFWQQLGLIEALSRFELDFELSTEAPSKTPVLSFELSDKFLYIYPENKKQEYIANGLYVFSKELKSNLSEDLSSNETIQDVLASKYGGGVIDKLNGANKHMIDPITKDLLEFEDMPTNLLDNLSGQCLDKLFNDPVDHPSDLSSLRARQSEYLLHLLYNEIMMAHTKYVDLIKFQPNDAKLKFDESYLMKHITGKHEHSDKSGGTSIIDFVNPFSPVDELVKASKVVRTGRGGLPSKRAAVKSHRNIHESYIGNIGANSTSESADVGLVNHHSMGVFFSSSRYGKYGSLDIESLKENDNWKSLGIDEALTPFQNQLDAGRMILARTHSVQKVPIVDGELPLVQTGAEFIVPQLSSKKFCIKAERDGEIISVNKDILTVKFTNGDIEKYDVGLRYANTKRNSTIKLSFDTLKPGETFSKNQLIAWSTAFKNEGLALGRNVVIALMNYKGSSFEDGYVISKSTSNKFKTETIIKIPVLIPKNTKILSMKDINDDTVNGETLIEFTYTKSNIEDYLDELDLIEDEDEGDDISSLYQNYDNKHSIKVASIGGNINNIKIYVNNRDEIDSFLIDKWKQQIAQIKFKINELQKTTKDLDATDNIDMSIIKTGGFKHKGKIFEGVLIEFYISNVKSLEIGDKMSNRYGAKGIVTSIITDDSSQAEYSGNIEIFLASTGVLGRKNIALIKELYLGKILYELKQIITNDANDGVNIAKIKKKIFNIYTLLNNNQAKSLNFVFDSHSDEILLEKFKNNEIDFNLIVVPFSNITFENIEKAAKILEIPLDEHIFIKDLGTWTKTKVPVGRSYYSTLEQLSSDYESTRSVGGYVGSTGSPTKGKKRLGGQSIGDMDVNAFLTYEAPNILNELMVSRSDNIGVKRELINNLRSTGKSNIPIKRHQGTTSELFNTMMLGMGLIIRGKV